MKILHLTLKRKWFIEIASGIKIEEYREIKPYWNKRLIGKKFDAVLFKNGYSKNAPSMLIELKRIHKSYGLPQWGAPENKKVYILQLGDILEMNL